MKPFAVFSLVLLAASCHGGVRQVRQSGWSAPPPSGWSAPPSGWPAPGGTNIAEAGASSAVGVAGAVSEHASTIGVTGSNDVPGLLSFYNGGDTGVGNNVYNSQQSVINADGSSEAYQSNSASNQGYASDYLGGDAQGLNVDVTSSGWSAVEGEGAVGQVDALDHSGGPAAPPPPPPPSGWGWSGAKRP